MTNAIAIRFQNQVAEMKAAFTEDRGAAMAEYGLLLALVALAAIGILTTLGGQIAAVFGEASDTLGTATGSAGTGTTPTS